MVTDRNFFENRKQVDELEDEIKKLKRRIEFLENQLAEKDREISNMFGRSY
jgi:hypothetical protein